MFGELRKLLAIEEPYCFHFREVMNHLLHWDDPSTLDVAVDYVEQHIQDWNMEHREYPLRELWPSFPEGEPHRAALLVTSLEFYDMPPLKLHDYHALTTTPLLSNLGWFRSSNHKAVRDNQGCVALGIGVLPGDADNVARMLGRSPYLKNLKEVSLVHFEFSHEGVLEIADSPNTTGLRNLNLSNNNVGHLGAQIVARGHSMGGLEYLYMGNNRIGLVGALAIASSPTMSNLRELDLWRNDIGDAGARQLAESPYLGNLRSLSLSENNLSLRGLSYLSESKHLSKVIKGQFSEIRENLVRREQTFY